MSWAYKVINRIIGVQNERYSIAEFDQVAAFEALYLRTSSKGGTHAQCSCYHIHSVTFEPHPYRTFGEIVL